MLAPPMNSWPANIANCFDESNGSNFSVVAPLMLPLAAGGSLIARGDTTLKTQFAMEIQFSLIGFHCPN